MNMLRFLHEMVYAMVKAMATLAETIEQAEAIDDLQNRLDDFPLPVPHQRPASGTHE